VVIDAQPVTNGFNGLTDLGWFKVGGLEFDPYIVRPITSSPSRCAWCSPPRVADRNPAGLILQAIRDDQKSRAFISASM